MSNLTKNQRFSSLKVIFCLLRLLTMIVDGLFLFIVFKENRFVKPIEGDKNESISLAKNN